MAPQSEGKLNEETEKILSFAQGQSPQAGLMRLNKSQIAAKKKTALLASEHRDRRS
jgi:hypothetical protein